MSPNLRQFRQRRKAHRLRVAILTITTFAACDPKGNPRQSSLLFSGGTVLTFDSLESVTNALRVVDGRIVDVQDLQDSNSGRTALVDLRGAVIAPALSDHHVHLFNVGLTLLNDRDHERLFVDLSSARSLTDVFEKIRTRAARSPAGAWIVGAGWNQVAWGMSALPTRDTLDRAAPDHPVYLSRSDGHAGWVNTRALALARVDGKTVAPDGGAIVRDATGTPTGLLLERANERMVPLIPAVADSDVIAAYRLGAEALAARGVTRVYDAGVLAPPGVVALNAPFEHFLALLRRADSLAPLPVEVNLMIPAPSALADSLLASPSREWALTPRIRITHVKLFADGAFGSRGAALSHAYADDASTTGVLRMPSDSIAAIAIRALDAGLGAATHAIGDEAVHRALDAYEQILKVRPNTPPGRLRIEHFSYVQEADIARALRSGVVLSIQSGFNSGAHDDAPFGATRVGAENEPRVYAWRRLAQSGARLAEGSDYFTRPGPALYSFEAALVRRYAVASGLVDSVARVQAYRFEARWFNADGETSEESLTSGKPADFVILSRNPLTTSMADLGSIRVLATIHNGTATYLSPEAPATFAPLARGLRKRGA